METCISPYLSCDLTDCTACQTWQLDKVQVHRRSHKDPKERYSAEQAEGAMRYVCPCAAATATAAAGDLSQLCAGCDLSCIIPLALHLVLQENAKHHLGHFMHTAAC